MVLQPVDFLGHGHEWARIHIERHGGDVSEAKLPAGASSEAIDLTQVGEYHGVDIPAAGVNQLVLFEGVDAARNWLVRISVLVSGKGLGVGMAQLATGSRTPGIEMTSSEHSNGVCFAARNLLDILIFERLDHFGHRLVGAAVLVLRHALSVWVT